LSFKITDPNVSNVDVAYSGSATTLASDITSIGVQARTDSDITGIARNNASDVALVEGDLIINGVEIGAVATDDDGTNLAEAINLLTDEHGVVATVASNTLTLNSADGTEISIKYGDSAPASTSMLATTGLLETNSASTSGKSVADIDISTSAGAQSAIDTIDAALATITDSRGEMGAVQNRLESTMANLGNISENVSAARSRIMDTDFAAETAALTRTQIMQQAGVAMLSQANSQPQMVLSLLQ
jgi:flagellin